MAGKTAEQKKRPEKNLMEKLYSKKNVVTE